MNYCQSCGRPFWTKTEAMAEANAVRPLLERLATEKGSLNAASRAFAERYGKKPETIARRFDRLRAGQECLFDQDLRDELQVML